MKRFHVLTIFPKILDSYLGESLFKRAIKKKLIKIEKYDLRDFTKDKHHKVDNKPFGGGPGMVLMVEPIYLAIKKIKNRIKKRKSRIILFSTRGERLTNSTAKRLAKYDDLIFICGRYEGVDERVAEHIADEEISLGDFVLAGGEIAALATIETVSRMIPGFLGKEESLEEIKGSFPTYTKPPVFNPEKDKIWKVPEVLLSGNHKKISQWRESTDLQKQ